MNILFDEHLQVLKALNQFGVKYLLIGGYAVNYYGYSRTTGDMDLWIEPTNSNKKLIIQALRAIGVHNAELEELNQQDFGEHLMFTIGEVPRKMDFLTIVNLVKFDDAFSERQVLEIDGIELPIVHYNHLVLMKMNTGRTQDQLDLEELQKIHQLDQDD